MQFIKNSFYVKINHNVNIDLFIIFCYMFCVWEINKYSYYVYIKLDYILKKNDKSEINIILLNKYCHTLNT